MAVKGEILFKDAEGNDLEGPRPNGSCTVLEFSQAIKLPTDYTTGQVTGSRIYEPFIILKEIDKLTPFMFQYCAEGQVLKSVEISLFEIAEATGKETVYFKYTLDNARVVEVENLMPTSVEANKLNISHLERVHLVAESVQWEHVKGSTMFQDQGFFSFKIPGS
jgi:type VI secretion system secreted protein Hcp